MQSEPSRNLVVFDIDGTILDSRDLILAAHQIAFSAHGLAVPASTTILPLVGLSHAELFRELVGAAGPIESLTREYKAAARRMRAAGHPREALFPGAAEVVQRLAARPDCALGIATGKSSASLRDFLALHGWRSCFETMHTSDDAPSKPDPAMILRSMADAGVPPRRTLMVGDSILDMSMAKAAGVMAVGVRWGNSAPDALHGAGADVLIADFSELDGLIARNALGQGFSEGAVPQCTNARAST